ncbi:type I secretion system permease/ATPase [Pseudooceanicola nanhaiensis]|uniref:type I secretion system permease/ATPase n=1 Tax=Pseudooceanicola nanhaiensis TaxID=375761 RepID=UPI001CD2757B|nr:type I secretion system permease/ATPase [Pseudooceanicola nanhaiensis]MCA0921239.1 type I secretion system permease/ATPase [Pseudooceanicola nanhaiensis]
MTKPLLSTAPGRAELRKARSRSRGLLWSVALFSTFVNLLMLTGPLYMLQVYDRVLGSRSVETLVALTILVAFLFLLMGFLDALRGQLLARIGARTHRALDERVFKAVLKRGSSDRNDPSATGLRDLDSVQGLMGSPVVGAMFDLPWTPLFLFGISLFHPWLGILALAGGALLIVIAGINQVVTSASQQRVMATQSSATILAERLRTDAESVQAMGLGDNAYHRWHKIRGEALEAEVTNADLGSGFTASSRSLRLFLQSAMLALGAYLVLQQQVTPGAMIASSVLMGRALAPVELLLGQWRLVQRGRRGWQNLAVLLTVVPPERPRTELPVPKAHLEGIQATVAAPGEKTPNLRLVSFEVLPGEALGVIGPSGAGKSTLARAITGTWPTVGGKIRLDGAALDQYTPEDLGRYIGYLPQKVQLFDGTIAENIARLSPTPDAEKVVAAARLAGAHEMILQFPDGYDTPVAMSGGRLSGGQIQRIGLARALYDSPVVLVLDEPNSNLDNEGSEALNEAIRATKEAGGAVLIMAHRPAAIKECDKLLMLVNGTRAAFGPKDEVLRQMVQNHEEISRNVGGGGLR